MHSVEYSDFDVRASVYKDKNANPDMNKNDVENVVKLPEGLDSETLLKVLTEPEMAKIIKEAAKKIKEK